MKKFVTIFSNYKNFHFYKDPGQIPYRFKNKGWEAELVCIKKEESYLQTNYLPIVTVPILRFDIGLIWYLVKTSRKIDVLNVYHFQWRSLWLAFIYKLLNPKGVSYLKMDNCNNCGPYPWECLFDKQIEINFSNFLQQSNTIKHRLKNKIIPFLARYIDLYSIEDQESRDYYENKYPIFRNKIITTLNGHTIDLLKQDIKLKSFEEKENLIISVGRLGTYQKNTLSLLKGYASTAKEHKWNLALAGPIDTDFVTDKDEFFNAHPELESRICFVGNLEKPELFDLYNRAKIFILPSNFETFANVYSEAAFFGNLIITSPYTSIKNLITEEKLGLLVEPQSSQEIGDAIIRLISNEEKTKQMSQNVRNFALANLNWDDITNKLQNEFEQRKTL